MPGTILGLGGKSVNKNGKALAPKELTFFLGEEGK